MRQNAVRLVIATWGLALTTNTAFAVTVSSGGAVEANFNSSDVILLIIYVLLALVFSFMCSVAEAVLLSITPSFIEGLKEKKPKQAEVLQKLKVDNVDRSLAAILTLNTIAHTVGAIGSGAKATIVFGSAWFGVFSAVMTLLILFLSEIIPKTLGAVYWRGLTGLTAKFVQGLIWILYPLIFVSELLTKLIAKGKGVHVFSREEFVAMTDLGERAGQIREHESRIIRNLFRFDVLTAKDIMTPRMVVVALKEELTVKEAIEEPRTTSFSRIPTYGESLDDVTGFVLKEDLLLAMAKAKGETKLTELRRNLMTVPSDMNLTELFDKLLNKREHIALVQGQFGGTDGIVSLEDIVETLTGMEIVDEMDKVEDMQSLARAQWRKRAEALGIEVDAIKITAESDEGAS